MYRRKFLPAFRSETRIRSSCVKAIQAPFDPRGFCLIINCTASGARCGLAVEIGPLFIVEPEDENNESLFNVGARGS